MSTDPNPQQSPSSERSRNAAVDVGGTFTDVVSWSEEGLRIAKSDTTPRDLTEGFLSGIGQLEDDLGRVALLFHGTTVVINALLEGRGARTALVTTEGFRDVYEIARGSRPSPYRLVFERPAPLVPRRHRFEIAEEMSGGGESLRAPDPAQVRELAGALRAEGIEAVAVCLINSYANGAHERAVVATLREELPDVPVVASHELVSEWREFERTSTTVMNAFVAPIMERYIARLQRRLAKRSFAGQLLFMQSSGGSMSPATATAMPIALVESGPASGMVGAAELARVLERPRVVGFDMGGTTAKAALILDYQVTTTRPYWVGGVEHDRPSLFPVVDLIEVGSGGGSIARATKGGSLAVGPESAGADPGPVAYGRGGTHPTVTDANLVLGRLSAADFLGGSLRVDEELSRQRMREEIAEPLGLSLEEAAAGIVEIADNNMALAVRRVSIERGEDPTNLTMVAFGGGGPTHAASVARQLGIPAVVIPPAPETFSAFGMLLSDIRRRVSRTLIRRLDQTDADELQALLDELEREAVAVTTAEVPELRGARYVRSLELRYVGQEHALEVTLPDQPASAELLEEAVKRFERAHEAAYGYTVSGEPIQIVNAVVTGHGALDAPSMEDLAKVTAARSVELGAATERQIYFAELGEYVTTPVVTRGALSEAHEGPLVVQEYGSTTIVPPRASARLVEANAILIEVGK